MRVIWQRASDVLWRRSGSRALVSCGGQDDIIVVGGTAAVIWELLDRPVEQSELVATLASSFGADRTAVQAQVTAFLDELWALGAVQRA